MFRFESGVEAVPGYRLVRRLGEGSYGQVWLATGPGQTDAALKFIHLHEASGAKEFRALSLMKKIKHPHLLPITGIWLLDEVGNVMDDEAVTDLDDEDKSWDSCPPALLVVAMVVGDKTLLDLMHEYQSQDGTGIPRDELLNYMTEAAKGIDYLNSPRHDLGDGPVAIQHRDIKPHNILLMGNAAVVCDFGVARVLHGSATATGMMGSPAYMAPETIEGRQIGTTSDQYSLAITYYQLMTTYLPFPTDANQLTVIRCHLEGTLQLDGLKDEEERGVVAKAISQNPGDRYGSCLEFVEALRLVGATKQPPLPPELLDSGTTLDDPHMRTVNVPIDDSSITDTDPSSSDAAVPSWKEQAKPNAWERLRGVFLGSGEPKEPAQTLHFESDRPILRVEPADAAVYCDERELKPAGEGAYVLPQELPKRSVIRVSRTGFEEFCQEVSQRSLKRRHFRIALTRKEDYHVVVGNEALEAGDLDKAIEEFEMELAHPTRFADPARYGLGRALQTRADQLAENEQYSEAVVFYGRALNINPRLRDSILRKLSMGIVKLGDQLLDTGHRDTALESYNRALKLDASLRPMLREKLSRLHIEKGHELHAIGQFGPAIGEFQRARSFLNDVEEVDDDIASSYLDWVQELIDTDDFSAALEKLQSASEEAPTRSGEFQEVLASLHLHVGEKEVSEKNFENAVKRLRESKQMFPHLEPEIRPMLIHALISCGNDLMSTGAVDEAIVKYGEALDCDPTDVTALVSRAVARLRRAETDSAIEDLQQVQNLDPKAALDRLDQAIEDGQESAPLLKVRGQLMLRERNVNAAAANFEWAWRLDFNDFPVDTEEDLTRLPAQNLIGWEREQDKTIALELWGVTREELASLPLSPSLRELTIRSQSLDDDGLTCLGNFTQVVRLRFAQGDYTADSIRRLAERLPYTVIEHDLVEMVVADERLAAARLKQTGADLRIQMDGRIDSVRFPLPPLKEQIAELETLKKLRLVQVDLGCEHMIQLSDREAEDYREVVKRLPSIPRLKRLSVANHGGLNDGLMNAIGGCGELEELAIELEPEATEEGVTDAGLAQLARLTGLRKLGLIGCRITDEGVRHLRSLTNLEHLDLTGTGVSLQGIQELAGSESELAVLHLGHTNVNESDAKRIETLFPGCRVSGSTFAEIGQRAVEQGRFDAAIDALDQAIELHPDSVEPRLWRGFAWLELGDYPSAVEDYTVAIKLRPSGTAYHNRGLAHERDGNILEARGDMEAACEIEPDWQTTTSLARLHYHCGNYQESLDICNECVEKYPENQYVYFLRGWIQAACPLEELRDGLRAIEDAWKACELTSWTNDFNLRVLAASYAEFGDFEEAVKWLQKAILVAPNNESDLRGEMLQLFRDRIAYQDEKKATNHRSLSTN